MPPLIFLCKSINIETQLDNLVLSSVWSCPSSNNRVYLSSQGFTLFSPTKGLVRFRPRVEPHLHLKMFLLYNMFRKSKYFSSNFPLFCGSWFQIPPAACLLPEKDFPGFSQKSNVSIFWAAANLWNTIWT